MVSAKPSSLLSGISLVGFRGSRSSGRQERIGTAKVGYTITVNTGTGPTNVLLGVATVPFSGIGAFFVNAGETVKATGLPGSPPATYGDVAGTILTTFYSATITDTNGTATFTASATLPGDGNGGSTVANTTIIGNGTSKLTIERIASKARYPWRAENATSASSCQPKPASSEIRCAAMPSGAVNAKNTLAATADRRLCVTYLSRLGVLIK